MTRNNFTRRLVSFILTLSIVLSSVVWQSPVVHAWGLGDLIKIGSQIKQIGSGLTGILGSAASGVNEILNNFGIKSEILDEVEKFASDPITYVYKYIKGEADNSGKPKSSYASDSAYYSLLVGQSQRLGYNGKMGTTYLTKNGVKQPNSDYYVMNAPKDKTFSYYVNGAKSSSGTLGSNNCTAWFDASTRTLYLQNYNGGPIGFLCYTEPVNYNGGDSKKDNVVEQNKKGLIAGVTDIPLDSTLTIVVRGNSVITERVGSNSKDAIGIVHIGHIELKIEKGANLTINCSVSRGLDKDAYGIVAQSVAVTGEGKLEINVEGPKTAGGIRTFGTSSTGITSYGSSLLTVNAKTLGSGSDAIAFGVYSASRVNLMVSASLETSLTAVAESTGSAYSIYGEEGSILYLNNSGTITLRYSKGKGAAVHKDVAIDYEPSKVPINYKDYDDATLPYRQYRGKSAGAFPGEATPPPTTTSPGNDTQTPPTTTAPLSFVKEDGHNISSGTVNTQFVPKNLSAAVSGGTGPYTFSITSGPSWLKITTSGVLTGTRPASISPATNAVINVKDSKGASKSISISVGNVTAASVTPPGGDTTTTPSGSPLNFIKQDSFNVPSGAVNTAMSAIDVSTAASGGTPPYTFSKTSGPSWLNVSASGVISGTRPANSASAANGVIAVKDSAGATKSIPISVGSVTAGGSTTIPGDTTTIPTGTVLNFVKQDSFNVPSGAVNTAMSAIDVSGAASGGTPPYTFSKTSGPAWLNVSANGVISGTRPANSASAANGVIAVKDSAGATKSIPISVGSVTAGSSTTTPGDTTTTSTGTALNFIKQDSFNVPSGAVNTAMSAIDVSGAVSGGTPPYTFSKTSGPVWLNVSASGVISGTRPGSTSTSTNGVIAVTDSTGATKSMPLTIGSVTAGGSTTAPDDTTTAPTGTGLNFIKQDSFNIPSGVVNSIVNYFVLTDAVSGGTPPYTFSKTSGPAWLVVTADGIVTGTRPASTSTSSNGVFMVTDSAGLTKSIPITIGSVTSAGSEAPPIIGPAGPAIVFTKLDSYNIPTGIESTSIEPFDVSATVSGGTAPYIFSITTGPAWLQITPDGLVYGTRPAGSASQVSGVIQAKDSVGMTKSIPITVGSVQKAPQPEVPIITPGSSSEAIVLSIDSTHVVQGSNVLGQPAVPPLILNGRTMLPFRYLVQDLLGGEVGWDGATRTVTAKVGGHTFRMVIDEIELIIDGEVVTKYGQAPVIVNGSTLLPLRAFEAAVSDIGWNAETRSVTIKP